MIYRKYEFVPSRAQTMFGSVVHQTVEDLHERLIVLRTSRIPIMSGNMAELEAFIEKQFEENYYALSVVCSQFPAPEAKNTAKMQVILYWRKLHTLASSVVETEVRLTLFLQTTPKGRTFSIGGCG